MNLAGVSSLTRRPVTGNRYRAIQPQFWKSALNTKHTLASRSRFSAGVEATTPFQLLYLAENPQVALFEVQALYGTLSEPGRVFSHPNATWTELSVNVVVQSVVDLTLVAEQRFLDTSVQEMTGDWEAYHIRTSQMSVPEPSGIPAPTQELGQALFDRIDIEGFLTVSAKVPWCRNLVVFPSKMSLGSHVVFSYPATREEYRIDSSGEQYLQLP